jgi:hypothetical protein
MGYFTDNDLNLNKDLRFFDYPFYKRLDPNGNLYNYYNEEALTTAFTIWLTSAKRENLRTAGGGVLYRHLGKDMTEEKTEQIRDDIKSAAELEFKPELTFKTVNVIADLENKKWRIYIEAFNAEYNIGFSSAMAINNY